MKPYQILTIFLAMVFYSCSDNNQLDEAAGYDGISFSVSDTSGRSRSEVDNARYVDMVTLIDDADTLSDDSVNVVITVGDMDCDEVNSRASQISGVSEIDNFGIYAYYYKSATSSPQPFFDNETAVNMNGYWSTADIYYWPTAPGSSLRFWAMARTDAPGVSVTRGADGPESMMIDYTVPQRAVDQSDLLLAVTENLNTPNVRVPLYFRHLCSAVKFVFGSEMQPGRINNITLSGIKSRGQYTVQWDNLSDDTSFSLPVNKNVTEGEVAGSPILADAYTLMMIPQVLGPDAELIVTFVDNVTGRERTMSASLAGGIWAQGKVTTYRIGISPDYKLEFTRAVEQQDAHYVICNSAIKISGLPESCAWTLKATASDGSDPTVQLTADVNEYVKQGFWTDKEMADGTPTGISARGSDRISGTGSGEFPLTVFLPENVGDSERTVTLSLSVNGAPVKNTVTQQITQLNPDWLGSAGWERIEDGQSGVYGFSYTAKHVYVYNNSSGLITANRVRNMISNLVNQYNASSYVDFDSYDISAVSKRFYVAIDYSKLSNMSATASSSYDGHLNTVQLFNFGGSAISNTFEQALLQMKRVGTINTPAFRRRADNDPSDVPQEVEGTLINESQALSVILKKNRYFLNRFRDSATGVETIAPRIRESDIVWYLPAYQQFDNRPGGVATPGDYWSSTAFGDAANAYLGNGAIASRTSVNKIIAVRNRP